MRFVLESADGGARSSEYNSGVERTPTPVPLTSFRDVRAMRHPCCAGERATVSKVEGC